MLAIPNTKLIQIVTNQNPFNFLSGERDLGQIRRIHLKSLILPNTEYNINSKSNIVNITSVDMLPQTQLPLGQYNIGTLITALQTILNISAAPNTFAITQNDLTKKLTFTKSGGAEFTINLSSIKRVLGLVDTKTSVGLTLTCDGIPDLSGLRMVSFQSSNVGKFLMSQGDTSSDANKSMVLGSLPVVSAFGALLKYEGTEANLNSVSFSNFKNVNNFSMSLVDGNGKLLELNGVEFIISFEVHHN